MKIEYWPYNAIAVGQGDQDGITTVCLYTVDRDGDLEDVTEIAKRRMLKSIELFIDPKALQDDLHHGREV